MIPQRLLQGRVDDLCCSHNIPLCDAGLLGRVADLFDDIKAGRAVGRHYEGGLIRYQQPDFAIVTLGR